jgi:DNA repair photolyase
MPLKKVVEGSNMYDFVTHCHSHLGGKCPHLCSYCFVQQNRFGVPDRYKGEPRLIEKELLVNYGSGKTIFIEHMNDLFAEGVWDKDNWVDLIFDHCRKYPENKYVFQTKAPMHAYYYSKVFPSKSIIGTTIETTDNIRHVISEAETPEMRKQGIRGFADDGFETFVTIEPIMDMDVDVMIEWMKEVKPSFINIGADSKNCGLPEPSPEKVRQLIDGLQKAGITIKKKTNLERLLRG